MCAAPCSSVDDPPMPGLPHAVCNTRILVRFECERPVLAFYTLHTCSIPRCKCVRESYEVACQDSLVLWANSCSSYPSGSLQLLSCRQTMHERQCQACLSHPPCKLDVKHFAAGHKLPGSVCRRAFSCTHVKSGVSAAQVFNLGFTTHTGTVAAADEWGEPVQRMPVNPSIPGSIAFNLL